MGECYSMLEEGVGLGEDSGVESKAFNLHVICIWKYGKRGNTGGKIYCFCQVCWETQNASLLLQHKHC